ncbi:MAG TPA: S8 family serine peptidase, partial [Thermomicrobiales bacterium]|nr:S8 family serine peptidase [Thermomicrobiales bacterium]
MALIDSGVDPNTGDLNVAGGTDCVGAGTYADQSGHGTHVAGTIAALDNNIGVVGVAPGARIWSVRALNGSGVGSDSTLICGLDWVYAHRATIDVVNMSVVGSGDDIACTRSGPPNDGSVPYSPMHEAVCKLYDAGIPIVAAAGNNKMNASNVTPATFGEVIAVSAFADYDGKPGGTGAKPLGCGQSTLDDRFYATSTIGSNFGPDVDIMAPGVCVQSTAMGGGTAIRTGTSMAAPHVTGAIALYLSQNSSANVEAVKDWLYGLAVPQDAPGGILGGDPDGISEPVLKVSLGGIPLATLTSTPTPTGTVVAPKNAYKLTKSGASGGASNYVRDNNLGTVWATRSNTPPNAFVWVQLAQSSPIGSIRWIMGETGFADRYWIETSNDLVTWTRIAKRGNKPVGVWNEVMPTGVSAKYVRFRYDNPYGDRHLGGIAEIQVWAPGAPSVNPSVTPTAGPPPVKYAIASTKQSLNSKNGIKVLDGNASTYWITNTSASPPSSAVLQLSLGTTKFVGAVRWMFGLEGKADVVKIETSTNEVTWTTVAIRTNASLYQWQEFTVNQNAKFVRFKVENPNGDVTIGGIAEAEIWSATGGPLTNVTLPTTPTPAATQTSIPTVTSTVEGQNAPTDTPTATAS